MCGGRNCNNKGLDLLTVKFLNKREWFCSKCKLGLIKGGLVINSIDEPLDRARMTGGKSAEQCDAVDCYEAATEVIAVSAGKYGIINLNLCHKCAVTKFQVTTNTICKNGSLKPNVKVMKRGGARF